MESGYSTSYRKMVWVLLACLPLSNCKTVDPTHPISYTQSEQIINESIKIDKDKIKPARKTASRVPGHVSDALIPSLSGYKKSKRKSIQRFDVSANKIPAKEFFMGLVNGTNLNMLVHNNITGTISVDLKNVTIRQTLEAVHDMYGYDYRKTSYGYEVFQPKLVSRLFHVNYLDVQRKGKSVTKLTTGQVSDKVGTVAMGAQNNTLGNTPQTSTTGDGDGSSSSIETKSEMEFWKTLEASIKGMVGSEPGHNVTVNSQTGIIAVRAYPAELKEIYRLINNMQASLNRQVIIEAKILEVRLTDEFQAGIDWGLLNNPAALDPSTGRPSTEGGLGQAGNKIFEGTELRNISGIFALRVNGNFNMLINLLQSQGNVQVLSSPHISTVNNQKAVIKVGSDEFFVTGVSTSNTIVGTNTIPSQDVSLTPFFSGITLDVTPEISNTQTVVLHIHPSVSEVKEQVKEIGLGSTSSGSANNLTLPLAMSTIRESDNIVRAKNGQVIVIGGLMQNNTVERIIGTPGLSKIPFFGSLFRRTAQESVKSELVILLRPIVVTSKSNITQLEDTKKRFKILRRPLHQGGLPRVFGNQAEEQLRNEYLEDYYTNKG